MADLRESFPVLENFGTQAGEPLHKVLQGDAAAAKNALAALTVKDSAGNLQYLTLNANGEVPVTLDGGRICKSGRGVPTAGSATFVEVASILLITGKTYENLDWVVSCFRDAIFEIVWISDYGVTNASTILADVLVGPGDFTDSGALKCQSFTASGFPIDKLVVRAKNINALSDFRASISIGEVV